MDANQEFENLKKNLFKKFFDMNPHFASYLGLHDPYDYQLPKGDTSHVLANFQLIKDFVDHMKKMINYDSLNDNNKIDWEIMEKAVPSFKFEVYERRMHELNPDAFDEVGGTFFAMITRDYAPLEKRIDAIIGRLEKLPKYLEEFRSRFDNTRPVKLWTEVAIESAKQIPGLFQFIANATKGKISGELHGKLIEASSGLMQPFQEHMGWLEGLRSKTVDEWALGKEKFEKLLKLRGLGMDSDQILQLGYKYLKEMKDERKRIANQISPDKSVKDVVKEIEKNAPKTFEEAQQATRQAMEDAKQFIIQNNIAKVYEEDKLVVEETPAFLAPLIPFAAMMMPSRYDKPMIGVYIVTRPKDISNLGSHLNYANVRNTAVHEAYPGHFLQGSVSNRSSITHMLADSAETVEGWAHYCEQMMMEHGFVTSLESKLVQINDVIWRAVRIIVDVKLSRGEMPFEDAVKMLMEEVGMSKEGATAEVRRYTQTPGYPLSYLIGKHLILELREEVKQKMGAKFDEKEFHDTITANGYLPISLLRRVFEHKIANKS